MGWGTREISSARDWERFRLPTEKKGHNVSPLCMHAFTEWHSQVSSHILYFVKYQGTLCFFCWRPDGWRISCLLSAHPHRIGPCILCVSLFTLAVGYSPGQNSLLPSGRTYPGTHVSWSLACKSNQFLKLGPWRWGQELLPESVVPSYSVSAKHNSTLHLFRICEIINSCYCIIHKMNREEFFWMFSLKGGSRASLSTWIS